MSIILMISLTYIIETIDLLAYMIKYSKKVFI